ncbi:D-inositol-3-phosphate glycosyltransferase [Candidatus Thermoflexus japonica]|uniref:D-inositol-3-phosphate glycosyltransferase n=1 Tax=Candidatus Thermoflexus japonica TaxID=2035417 RepID=A0A2H5Y931_9CHLR|nr:D-inositol-3-phosphate glycosyltransferase [Candidatus Thermoflexus japonica]
MDLAVITPFPPPLTGIRLYGLHLCQAMARTGHPARIVILTETSDRSREREVYPPCLEIHRTWRGDHPAAGFQLLRGLKRVGLRRVWVNFGFSTFGTSPVALFSTLVGLTVAARQGWAMLITAHEASLIDPDATEPLSRMLLTLFRWLIHLGVIAVPLRADLERLRACFPEASMVHIPHGSFYPPRALPEPENHSLLFFGSLAPYKGLATLLDAFQRLRERHPTLTLEIAGAEHPRFPNYGSHLRAACAHLPGIRWRGPVPEEEVEWIFARNTLVLLPYRQATGSSSVIYRAAAWGRPFVSSDLPALRATADEAGLAGNWVPPGDPEALARAIDHLLREASLREQQRQQNLRAIASCTMDRIAKAYLQIMESLPFRFALPQPLPQENG